MDNFMLVQFPDEKGALRGFRALEGLHRKDSAFVRGAALVERDVHGVLSLRSDTDGMLLASLGAIVARAPSELLEFLALELAAGTFALIADVGDESISQITARMEPLGGRVACTWERSPATTRSSSGPLEARSAPPAAPGARRPGAGSADTKVAGRHGPSGS
jgi:hypothetical protein